MQEFTVVPLQDIENYLSHYCDLTHLPSIDKERYNRALIWINSGRTDHMPDAMVDWTTARDVIGKEKIPIYDLSYIKGAEDDDLIFLM